jgi:hypothetical protein
MVVGRHHTRASRSHPDRGRRQEVVQDAEGDGVGEGGGLADGSVGDGALAAEDLLAEGDAGAGLGLEDHEGRAASKRRLARSRSPAWWAVTMPTRTSGRAKPVIVPWEPASSSERRETPPRPPEDLVARGELADLRDLGSGRRLLRP